MYIYTRRQKHIILNPKKKIRKFRDTGRNLFHVRYINLSYRRRGKVPRTQINVNTKRVIFRGNIGELVFPPRKTRVKRVLMNKMLAYSAIKIRANPPLLYSVLNPDTNSDSPSAKSKGVRLVSANDDASQSPPRGIVNQINQVDSCAIENASRLNFSERKIKQRRIKARLTS